MMLQEFTMDNLHINPSKSELKVHKNKFPQNYTFVRPGIISYSYKWKKEVISVQPADNSVQLITVYSIYLYMYVHNYVCILKQIISADTTVMKKI